MDNVPQTRQEKKGGKKNKDKNVYSAKHVRQQEALMAKRSETNTSTSKMPVKITKQS
jgi:hypothetical protein